MPVSPCEPSYQAVISQYPSCRPREKLHRPQTRRRRENNEESLDKMRTLRTNLVRAYEVHEWLTRREGRKYNLVVCHLLQALLPDTRCLVRPAHTMLPMSVHSAVCCMHLTQDKSTLKIETYFQAHIDTLCSHMFDAIILAQPIST